MSFGLLPVIFDRVGSDFDYQAFLNGLPMEANSYESLLPYIDSALKELCYGSKEGVERFIADFSRDMALKKGLLRDRYAGIKRMHDENLKAARREQVADHLAKLMPEAEEAFGLVGIEKTRYVISQFGVGEKTGKDSISEVTARPIFPSGMGIDLVTGERFVEIAYDDSNGVRTKVWIHRSHLTSTERLFALVDAPIDLQNVRKVSAWLVAACALVAPENKLKPIASKSGWVETPTGRRFVVPSVGQDIYVGEPRPPKGTLEGSIAPLRAMASLGAIAYPFLCLVGHAAAGPCPALDNKRNGVLMAIGKTSSGKTIGCKYAISLYGSEQDLSLVATDMTYKGLQDRANENQGRTILVDDVHVLRDNGREAVEQTLYYMGNGSRRVNATRSMQSQGGERFYGNWLGTSEISLQDTLQEGAQFRLIELNAPIFTSIEQADLVAKATRENYGVVGALLAEWYNRQEATLADTLDELARRYRLVYQDLKGDDAHVVARVRVGLMALSTVTGIELPLEETVCWLLEHIKTQRAGGKDQARAAFEAMVDFVQGMNWPAEDPNSTRDLAFVYHDVTLAWRRKDGGLDVNPEHPALLQHLRPWGGDKQAKVWANRGWVQRQGGGLKVRRKDTPGRVWRLTPEATTLEGSGFS